MKRVDSARSWMSEVHCLVNTYKFSNMPQNWNNFNNRKQKGIDVLFLICFEKFLVSNFFLPAFTLAQFRSIKDRRRPVFFFWIFNIYKFEQQLHYFQAEN